MNVLKVSAKSDPNAVAGAIIGVLKDEREVEIKAIGAGAINQSIKANAISRGYAVSAGEDLVCVPAFSNVIIDDEEKTAINLTVLKRTRNKVFSDEDEIKV